jgi:hypothetical protein
LSAVGVSLGKNENLIATSVSHIKEIELGRLAREVNRDKISEIFDREEKEELETGEVDKLILNSLCCEIMDEVMDLGNAYPQIAKLLQNISHHPQGKKGRKSGVGQSKIVQGERNILEHQWVQRPKEA